MTTTIEVVALKLRKPFRFIVIFALFCFLSQTLLAVRPEWTAIYNGSEDNRDGGEGVVVDDSGNVYVTGYETVSGPQFSLWVGKYDPNGLVQWTTTYSVADGSIGRSIDGESNIYVAGYVHNDANNLNDIQILKYNSTGLLQWTTTYNGPADNQDRGHDVAVDASGNVYVVGFASNDIWIGKYNTNGLLQWTTTYGGGVGYGVALDTSANIYVTGHLSNSLWVAKYNTDGLLQWTTTYSPARGAQGYGIAVDTVTGNVYVTGLLAWEESTGDEFWLGKYNNNGLLQWSTTYNGAGNSSDAGYSVAVDTSGNAYVTGFEYDTPVHWRIWTRKYGADGSIRWTATAPDNNIVGQGRGIAIDNSNNVYVAGRIGNVEGDVWTRKYSQAPSSPDPFEANAISTTSIKWIWQTTSFEDQFRVMASTGGAFSHDLSTGTIFWIHENLTANTSYSAFIEAFNVYGASTTPSLIRYTLANPPTGFNLVEVHTTSATVSWSANMNPAGTIYEVKHWVVGGSTVTTTVLVTSVTLTGLSTDSTVYMTVRALNHDNIPTSYDVIQSTFIPAVMISPDKENIIIFQGSSGEVEIKIPPDTFKESIQITVRVPAPQTVPLPTGNLKTLPTPINVELKLDKPVQPARDVEISVSYQDDDIGNLDENKLVIARYDDDHAAWVPLYSTRDKLANKVVAKVNHFSIFQIMQSVSAGDLSGVTIGPNILRPSQNPGQVMMFRNLPAGARIRIYTYVGELLYDTIEDGTGNAIWNGKNRSGKQVASGVYIVLITADGKKKTFNVAVER